MYKGLSRFRQALARKGRKITSRNLVASDAFLIGRAPTRTVLPQRLDKEVETVTSAANADYKRQGVRSDPVKQQRPRK